MTLCTLLKEWVGGVIVLCMLRGGPVKFIEITSFVRFNWLKTSTVICKINRFEPTKAYEFLLI